MAPLVLVNLCFLFFVASNTLLSRFLTFKKTKFFSQIQVFFTMIYSCWSWWLLSRLAMYGIQILNLTFLNLIFRFRFWFTFLKTKSKKSNRNILLRNKIINKFHNLYKNMFLIQYSFLILFQKHTNQIEVKNDESGTERFQFVWFFELKFN